MEVSLFTLISTILLLMSGGTVEEIDYKEYIQAYDGPGWDPYAVCNETNQTCVPDCDCAVSTCTTQTCSDGCDGQCQGTRTADWDCTIWTVCENGQQRRDCVDYTGCELPYTETQACTEPVDNGYVAIMSDVQINTNEDGTPLPWDNTDKLQAAIDHFHNQPYDKDIVKVPIAGDITDSSHKAWLYTDYIEIISGLTIPHVDICGNHDDCRNPTYYKGSEIIGNTAYLYLNTCDGKNFAERCGHGKWSEEEQDFLETTVDAYKDQGLHLVLIGHHQLWVNEDVYGYGSNPEFDDARAYLESVVPNFLSITTFHGHSYLISYDGEIHNGVGYIAIPQNFYGSNAYWGIRHDPDTGTYARCKGTAVCNDITQ